MARKKHGAEQIVTLLRQIEKGAGVNASVAHVTLPSRLGYESGIKVGRWTGILVESSDIVNGLLASTQKPGFVRLP